MSSEDCLTFSGGNFCSVYGEAVSRLKTFGVRANPRGIPVVEFPQVVVLQYPGSRCWLTTPGRGLNPFFACAEILWILFGEGNADWLTRFSKSVGKFKDPGESDFNAPYGKRIFRYQVGDTIVDQFAVVMGVLKKDPYARDSVISIWHPIYDNKEITSDRSCNNLIYFKLRNNSLDMTVCQRSNDIYLGTPYNAIQFAHLHAVAAAELSVDIGLRTQFINNLHFYLEGYYSVNLEDVPTDADSSGCLCLVMPVELETLRSCREYFEEAASRAEKGGLSLEYLLGLVRKLKSVGVPDYWSLVFTIPLLRWSSKGDALRFLERLGSGGWAPELGDHGRMFRFLLVDYYEKWKK